MSSGLKVDGLPVALVLVFVVLEYTGQVLLLSAVSALLRMFTRMTNNYKRWHIIGVIIVTKTICNTPSPDKITFAVLNIIKIYFLINKKKF